MRVQLAGHAAGSALLLGFTARREAPTGYEREPSVSNQKPNSLRLG